eukprot:5818651-Prymnesium_polylepis.1
MGCRGLRHGGPSVRLGRFGPFRTVSAVSRAGSAGAPFAHCASVHSLACSIRLCLYSLMLLSEQQHRRGYVPGGLRGRTWGHHLIRPRPRSPGG